jgi:hypothetical protein
MAKVKRLGVLDSIPGIINAMGKVCRAMWAEQIGSADGHRLVSSLSMIRAALESAKLEELAERLNKLEGRNETGNSRSY